MVWHGLETPREAKVLSSRATMCDGMATRRKEMSRTVMVLNSPDK